MAAATRSRSRTRVHTPAAGPGGSQAGPEGPTATAARGPASVQLRLRAQQYGSFRLQQFVLVEVAAALLLCAWAVDQLLVLPALLVSTPLLLLAVVRRRGRSLPDWLGTARTLRTRQRRASSTPVRPGTEPGLAPAVECDPALRTYAYGDRDRRSVGIVGDGTFVTAVLQVESEATSLRADRLQRPLPLRLVADALEVDGIRLESAQVVLHTQPAPALHLPQQSVAVGNYAPLQAQTGTPAVRITWIALKLDPELCPEAVTARGGGLLGAQKCVVRAVDQLASRLTGAGFRVTVLDEQELTSAVATSAGANPLVTAQAGRTEAPERRTEETARSWRCDNRRHTTYWVRRWPHLGGSAGRPLPQLVASLTAIPALATTFSLTLRLDDRREVSLCGHMRVTGRGDAELVSARRALEHAARQEKIGLVRLDREQLPGTLATLPLGGAR
ncbi:type VII secretion protein EccE [Streptomyces sp. NPDC093510]|uniref:type VII secretion protein EccE n=1 Tax=Streptomyces sp. NPDC093510 TaxID=3155199 RepID=UPI0034338AE8